MRTFGWNEIAKLYRNADPVASRLRGRGNVVFKILAEKYPAIVKSRKDQLMWKKATWAISHIPNLWRSGRHGYRIPRDQQEMKNFWNSVETVFKLMREVYQGQDLPSHYGT